MHKKYQHNDSKHIKEKSLKDVNMKKAVGLLHYVIYKILKSAVYSSYTSKTKFLILEKYTGICYRKQSKTWTGNHGSFIDHHS